MGKKKAISGFTEDTPLNLLLDAGAFFKNFKYGVDTYESAITAGKLLGATTGGGEFNAVPTFRDVEVDGVKGPAKGMKFLDKWDVDLLANLIEVTAETIRASLGAARVTESEDKKYDIIEGKNWIDEDDYFENVAWLGTISGSGEPVIIIIDNALGTEGFKIAPQDKNNAVIKSRFVGHYDAKKLSEPPYHVYYPKAE